MERVITKGAFAPINIEIVNKLKKSIDLHKRHSRIYFTIVKDEETLIVRVRQTRPPNGNIATKEQLIEIGTEVYSDYANGRKIIIHTDPYVESPVEVVNAEWIKNKMNKNKIGLKGLVEAFGISKPDISAQINNHKPIGQRSKAMYYYYFKSLEDKH